MGLNQAGTFSLDLNNEVKTKVGPNLAISFISLYSIKIWFEIAEITLNHSKTNQLAQTKSSEMPSSLNLFG